MKVSKYLLIAGCSLIVNNAQAANCPMLTAGDISTLIHKMVFTDTDGVNTWKLEGDITVNGKSARTLRGRKVTTAGGSSAEAKKTDAAKKCIYTDGGVQVHESDVNGPIDRLVIKQITAKCPVLPAANDFMLILNTGSLEDINGNNWVLENNRIVVNGKMALIGYGQSDIQVVPTGAGKPVSAKTDVAGKCVYKEIGKIVEAKDPALKGSFDKMVITLK